MRWRPLSKRGQPDPRLDEPTEGLPPYLSLPVRDWITDCFREFDPLGRPYVPKQRLYNLQLRFRLDPPLPLENGDIAALEDLLGRVGNDGEFGLDVIDYILQHINEFSWQASDQRQRALIVNGILNKGGSAWEIAAKDDVYQLARRAVGPVRDAIESIPASSRAHQHLVTAWNRLNGRDPDPSSGYREAVRAVEAAAKPVILPDNPRATLGQMIAAMRDKPQKWTTTIGTISQVQGMMETVWTSQLDRHGTDDDNVPLTVSAEQADAAFSICLNLARLFSGGHIRPNR